MFNNKKEDYNKNMKVEMRKGWFLAGECPYCADLIAKVGKSFSVTDAIDLFAVTIHLFHK